MLFYFSQKQKKMNDYRFDFQIMTHLLKFSKYCFSSVVPGTLKKLIAPGKIVIPHQQLVD